MPGGVMQLVATASQDKYVTGSPEMSYFKAVYKRHTNFAMESIKQTFLTKPMLTPSTNTYTCKIGRIADMLQDVYFCVRLPDIYADALTQFRWIRNIGQYMIYSYAIRLDTQLIDQGYGEWMDIWTELTGDMERMSSYNIMIGNTEDMHNPVNPNPKVVITNNRLTYVQYPVATSTTPSIKGRRLAIPLPFWFTKNPSLALPLVALQYQFVEITLEIRSINDLYQLYDESSKTWVSPEKYKQRNPTEQVDIGRFLNFTSDAPSQIDLDGFLECNFIFLDDAERRSMASQQIDLLVERVYRKEIGNTGNNFTIDLYIANPVKELIWFARRDDISSTNDWTNFTNKGAPIMKTSKIIWNGLDRIEEKDEFYFNKIQPYQHHTNSARDGLYCYSFAVYPEKWQPSGSFNASAINRIQLYTTANNMTTGYTYYVYTLYYNVFRVIGGTGGMVFAN